MPELTLEALADRVAALERQLAALTAVTHPPTARDPQAAGDAMVANPLYGDYLRAVEEYRREHNAIPDAGCWPRSYSTPQP